MELEEKQLGQAEERQIEGSGRYVGEGKGEQVRGNGFTGERRNTEEGRKTIIRRAAFDDLDKIMDINDNVYEGLDYMPTLFYTFMHSKLHVIYVCEEDGKLIFLANCRFHPECDDLVSAMSGRIRPSHQGRGLGTSDSSPIFAHITKEHPKITRYVADTLYTPNIAAKMHKWKLLYHWNVLLYDITDRQWLSRFTHIRQMTLNPIRPFSLSYSRAIEWLERSDQLVQFISKYAVDLFPIGSCWTPTPISRSGLRNAFSVANAMVSVNPAVTSTFEKSSSDNLIQSKGHLQMQDIGPKNTRDRRQEVEVVGLSFSTAIPCKYGLQLDISFFGDCENVLLSHVYSHLLHYVSMASDDVNFAVLIHFPLAIDSKNVEERLTEEMGKRILSVTQAVQYIAGLPKAKL